MIKIGITGGIGSGKTTVCKIFELLGVPVFYADAVAKNIYETDESLKNEVVDMFGIEILDENKKINKQKLATIVFSSSEKLEKLNRHVHPAVGKKFDDWANKQHAAYVIKEAAILFESGAYKQVDKTIVVAASEEIRIERVCKRDDVTHEDVLKRLNNQMKDGDRIKLADFVIENNENELLIPQVLAIHQKIIG